MPQSQRLSSVIPFAAIERPACPKCKAPMMLASIEQAGQGVDLQTFECAVCHGGFKTLAAYEDPMKSRKSWTLAPRRLAPAEVRAPWSEPAASPRLPGRPLGTRAVRCRLALETTLKPSGAILVFMGIRPDDVEKKMRALRRRTPLLDAWLDALNRLDGPNCRILASRNTSSQRRPLLPSVERHRTGRRLPHLVIVQRQSL